MRKAPLLLFLAVWISGCGATGADAPATSAPIGYRATVLADGPVAYWRMGEKTGTVMADETSHRNNGTYQGSVTLGQPGAVAGDADTAVAFDGASGAAIVPSSASLQVNRITIELWLKKAADTNFGAYVTKNFAWGGGPGTGWFEVLNNGSSGHLEFRVAQDGATLVSNAKLDLNTWYYVVATYDGASAKFYVNGSLDTTVSVRAIPAQTADPLYIGRRADGLFNNAVIGEVAIYPDALSADRITAHWRVATSRR